MTKQEFRSTILQLHATERLAMSTLYTQVGLLLTATLAIGAAVSSIANVEITRQAGRRFDCGLLTTVLVGAVFCLAMSVFHLYRAGMPRTKYPVVNIDDVSRILDEKCANGDSPDEQYDRANDCLAKLFRDATQKYRAVNEQRKVSVQKGIRWLAWAVVLAGTGAILSHIIISAGVING